MYHDRGVEIDLVVKRRINRLYRAKRKQKLTRNLYEEILYVPVYGAEFVPDATDALTRCNHMCLAKSKIDGTPGILHGMPSHSCKHAAFESLLKSGNAHLTVPDNGCIIELDVPSPECDHRRKKRKVNVIVLPQLKTEKELLTLSLQVKNDFIR